VAARHGARALIRVTVVTPVLNGARFLSHALESVRAQDHGDVEHIVVDGGSSDGTLAILGRAPGVSFTSAPDAGLYDAINRGFSRASGEILACLNADDVYAQGALATVAAHFESDPGAEVMYGDFRFMDGDGRPRETRRSGPFDLARLKRENCVPPHATFVRRRVVEAGGFLFDPSLRFAGDWDWVLRMALAGRRFDYVPGVLSHFRRHHASVTATAGWALKLREWRSICRRHRLSFAGLLAQQLVVGPIQRRLRSASG
jgi:glycosyltransferase